MIPCNTNPGTINCGGINPYGPNPGKMAVSDRVCTDNTEHNLE